MNAYKLVLTALISFLALATSACKTTESQQSAQNAPMGDPEEAVLFDDEFDDLPVTWDPLEPINRAIFGFNDVAYNYVLNPIGDGYEAITPEPVRGGISNFFDNLKFPIRFVSSLLQGKPARAGKETGKFLINSTAGFFGIVDVSSDIDGLNDVPAEDLGQTLGVWGIGNGPYLVLPILGPSSLRDAIGRVGDSYLHPFEHADEWQHWEWEYEAGLRALEIINELPEQIDRYELFDESALDPYISLREAYMQNRKRETER